jgi:hypothetical protein
MNSDQKKALDGQNGMNWWNTLSPKDRAFWLAFAASAVPSDAWEAFKREQSKLWAVPA